MNFSQIERYILWVNRTLSEANKTYGIQSLSDSKIRDGSVFLDIIEYLSGTKVTGIVNNINSRCSIHNIQMILDHIVRLEISMSLVRCADIERGNVQSVIKVLLGVIKHYKPHLVRPVTKVSFSRPRQRLPLIPLIKNKPRRLTDIVHQYSSPASRVFIDKRSTSTDHEMATQTAAVRPLSTGSDIVSISDHLINGVPDLPKDIKEIHNKLHELKYLLSRTNSISYGHTECNTSSNPQYILRHTSSQTDKTDSQDETSEAAHHRDAFISYQQEQLRFLRNENSRKTRMLDESTYTNALLRAGRLTEVDMRSIGDLLPTLRSIQHKQTVSEDECEQVGQLVDILADLIYRGDKSNSVAVVSPCNYTSSSSSAASAVTSGTLGGASELVRNNVHTSTKYTTQSNNASSVFKETKMIYSINNCKDRFLVTIPCTPTEITLGTVKKYVRHMVTKTTTDTNPSSWKQYRFLFQCNSISKDSKIELLDDQEIVPLLGDKISVTIVTSDRHMT